ncbi:PREDICTED: uncharacterized protein LOC108662791 [Theobroma cacao]|uniref:Uncharacterized protein LOC108662791 n=1 Tax=Theobroma cacao TaxID=3641 RepID=A0AB32WQ71_THECC|nr:PREDICTED: uncharacterized protein LOC108662791 [Theobroma cacao]
MKTSSRPTLGIPPFLRKKRSIILFLKNLIYLKLPPQRFELLSIDIGVREFMVKQIVNSIWRSLLRVRFFFNPSLWRVISGELRLHNIVKELGVFLERTCVDEESLSWWCDGLGNE